jgi:hypothetical protein
MTDKQPLSEEIQQQLINEIKRVSDTFCESGDHRLRTLRVGPGRRDCIFLQSGEFSGSSTLATQILNKSFVALQTPKSTRGAFSYTSLRSGKRIRISNEDIGSLRAAVSTESERPELPESAITLKLATVEMLGDKKIVRLTREGWDMMRLYLFRP